MRILIERVELKAKELLKAKNTDPDASLKPAIAAACGVSPEDVLSYEINKRSTDSRKKPDILLIYNVTAEIRDGVVIDGFKEHHVERSDIFAEAAKAAGGAKNPVVVGTGPAGLLAAYALARLGLEPVVIDRGRDVERREKDIGEFYRSGRLDTESNFLIGEGGAGTYSDGKLYTRTRDPLGSFVLDLFAGAGAPAEIKYLQRPHIGSDKLPAMVRNIRLEIVRMGGSFIWDKKVEGVVLKDGKCLGVTLSGGEKFLAPAVVLACGHSARDLVRSVAVAGVAHSLKGFQVGCRVEHRQEFVNKSQYRMHPAPPFLKAAEYTMTSRPSSPNVRQMTTFCMCPGGEVIPATSDENQLCTNGMSRYERDGEFSNAALICSHPPEDFGSADAAFEFLASLERKFYTAGGGCYAAPAQDADFFLKGRQGFASAASSYKFGLMKERLDILLPEKISAALREALVCFDRMIPGFSKNGKLIGVETRVSSPLRFDRRPGSTESSVSGLHVVGEAAGCAGGIISAAVDGLKAGLEIAGGGR